MSRTDDGTCPQCGHALPYIFAGIYPDDWDVVTYTAPNAVPEYSIVFDVQCLRCRAWLLAFAKCFGEYRGPSSVSELILTLT